MDAPGTDEFATFMAVVEPRLRRALVATYGAQRGREAAAEALSWAWEHRPQLAGLTSPVAYLFRVGQSRTRTRKRRVLFETNTWNDPMIEPGLAAALEKLTEHQRTAVVLIHGFGWTLREVAELRDIAVTTVQNHLERGLTKLRAELEVTNHV